MKKLISLLAALSVVTAGTIGAFAADGFTVDYDTTDDVAGTSMTVAGDEATIGAIEADEEGLYTVDLATVAGDQDQTTILAVEGKTIKVGSIKYINQSDATSFTFGMDDPTETVYVLAGGSAINPTLVAKIEVKADEPETFTISGTVTGFAGTTLPTVVANDGTTDYAATVNADGTFTVDVPAGATYTLKATKKAHLSYTKTSLAVATADIEATVKAGDLNNDDNADISDINILVNNFGVKSTDGSGKYSENYDPNEDTNIDISDINILVNNFGAKSISE